ncbi:hypothetical protein ESCO_005084 [Escovopsis weberi]|uniref:DUF7732 domain-containing protein n=1 Tax=Escovopsis weberi TaxID=150374 RepID=A0A0M8N7H7_ESCWE|nr:hypothetical protein ESCO_005084 [Escovopsis weberi]
MRFELFLLASSIFTAAAASAIDGPDGAVANVDDVLPQAEEQGLFKRKGGGGGSRGGGHSGTTASGGSPMAGRPNGAGNPPPKAMEGGITHSGSGPRPMYGGGRYYGGGGVTPFASGQRSPLGSIVPIAFLGAAIAFWPGTWPHGGANIYPYHDPYTFHNDTLTVNQTSNVLCACALQAECSCDDNTDPAYFDGLIGNGSYAALNKSVIDVALVNGSSTLLLNGTLPNGTTAKDPNSAAGVRSMLEVLGHWPVCVAVLASVFLA